jgi:hypothetical protein
MPRRRDRRRIRLPRKLDWAWMGMLERPPPRPVGRLQDQAIGLVVHFAGSLPSRRRWWAKVLMRLCGLLNALSIT